MLRGMTLVIRSKREKGDGQKVDRGISISHPGLSTRYIYTYIYILYRRSAAPSGDSCPEAAFKGVQPGGWERDPAVRSLEATDITCPGGQVRGHHPTQRAGWVILVFSSAFWASLAPSPEPPPPSGPKRADALYIKPFLYSNLLPDVVNLFS